jgi:3-hydroxybutyryl-CoA dehydratase
LPNQKLPRRVPSQPEVGARASFSRTFSEGDVSLFIGATWDVNPYHTDEAFARQSRFGRRIVPGLLTASLLTHMGGLWNFLATEMHFEFLGPVYIGDTVTATVEIVEKHQEKGWVTLDCRVLDEEGKRVLTARVKGYPGRFED